MPSRAASVTKIVCVSTAPLCEGIFGRAAAQRYVRRACTNRTVPLWRFVRDDLSLFPLVLGFFFLSQLDESKDFEERKLIRAAMRDLRKRKRGKENKSSCFTTTVCSSNQTHWRIIIKPQCLLNNFFVFCIFFTNLKQICNFHIISNPSALRGHAGMYPRGDR